MDSVQREKDCLAVLKQGWSTGKNIVKSLRPLMKMFCIEPLDAFNRAKQMDIAKTEERIAELKKR